MSSSRVALLVVVTLAVLLLSSALAEAQTSQTLYFTYFTPLNTYPIVCTTGTLSCTTTSNGTYNCPTVSGGTHYYYPTQTTPTFQSTLLTSSQAPLCERYTADFNVPLTLNGVTIAYGTSALPTCVNIRLHNQTSSSNPSGTLVPYADPDAVATYVNFTYGTSQSAVASCPAPVATTNSGPATVYFQYTITPSSGYNYTVCAVGSLSCTSLGSSQYSCSALNSGTEYRYDRSMNTTTTTNLTGLVECNQFGDGYLPLDYEGMCFGGSFFSNGNCVSWYGTNGASVGYSYNVIGTAFSYQAFKGPGTFTTTTTPMNPYSTCSAFLANSSNSNPSNNPNGSSPSHAAASLLSLLAIATAVLALFL